MNFSTSIHDVGGHILLLADEPNEDSGSGMSCKVLKVVAGGAIVHFKEGSSIYAKSLSSYRNVISVLFVNAKNWREFNTDF